MSRILGYCTNVHAGADLALTKSNLEKYAVDVKSRFSPDEPMGLGLWLSAKAAREIVASGGIPDFRDWLSARGLLPYTMNGFPYGDFHQEVVKHDVYLPVWGDPDRTAYTLDLIEILHGLLPAGVKGTISTLPVAWGESQIAIDAAAEQLMVVARKLNELREAESRQIAICIEPEPGCLFERSGDVVRFFREQLFDAQKRDSSEIEIARRHLQICHDTCHAAVMFESQADVIAAYQKAGIAIGKVQISSAIAVPFFEMDAAAIQAAMARLGEFTEDRYLHQTVCQIRKTGETTFYEDLPLALEAAADRDLTGEEWRVHFHVPLFADHLGALMTTRHAAEACLSLLGTGQDDEPHFEVETYAWDVLPSDLTMADLADGISRELQWAAAHFA